METVADVYLTGGVFCAAVFLFIMLWSGTFQTYAARNGMVVELGHLALRAVIVFLFWPLALVLAVVVVVLLHRFARQAEAGDPSDRGPDA